MKTLTDELKEYGLSNQKIQRVLRTLEQGKTVRSTGSKDIDAIFWNDDSNAEIILANGNSIERKLA